MSKCTLAPRAVTDLDDIAAFTASRWGEKQAIKYVREIHDRLSWLAANQELGRVRGEIRPGLRSYRQNSHMIFYEIGQDEIFVIGIPHASADFDAYFNP